MNPRHMYLDNHAEKSSNTKSVKSGTIANPGKHPNFIIKLESDDIAFRIDPWCHNFHDGFIPIFHIRQKSRDVDNQLFLSWQVAYPSLLE